MNILTDEIVEKGARALHELGHGPLETCRAEARACLAAVLPEIAEACAKVIEETPSRLFAMTHHETVVADRSLNAVNVKRELADRIRSLAGGAV
jgi:hypothetical protein